MMNEIDFRAKMVELEKAYLAAMPEAAGHNLSVEIILTLIVAEYVSREAPEIPRWVILAALAKIIGEAGA